MEACGHQNLLKDKQFISSANLVTAQYKQFSADAAKTFDEQATQFKLLQAVENFPYSSELSLDGLAEAAIEKTEKDTS